MTDRADVVVIGGGVLGASVALHLGEAGVGGVRLLERDELSQGTSAAGAGFIGLWTAVIPSLGAEELAVQRYGLEFYAGLAADGYDIDYVGNGMLWVAPDASAWGALEAMAGSDAVPDGRVAEPLEIEALTGGMVVADKVFRGLFHPSAAHISASRAGPAMVDRFRRHGGSVEVRRPVTELIRRGGRVAGVRTATGVIECGSVVLAAGAWNAELLQPLGVRLPAIPLVTSRIVTEPLGIPGTMPALFLTGLGSEPFSTLWVRGHHGALLWGGHYRTAPRNALVREPVPPRFDQLPIDGVMDCRRLGASASRFMPVFARYRSMTLAHGAPVFTPDLRSLVGPVPGIDGLYVVAGDNEAGVTHAPGYGKALADHIAHGASDLVGLDAWRLDRFDDRFLSASQVAEAVDARFASAT